MSLRVAIIHNLKRGGARRTLAEHLPYFTVDCREFFLATADPVSSDAESFSLELEAPKRPAALRPPLRYLDLARITRAWDELAAAVEAFAPDVVLAHPCQFLQAPSSLRSLRVPSVYFCHEPRRVDHDDAVRATRSSRTRLLYAPLYRMQRSLDTSATQAATALVTNSQFTAARIATAYGRTAEPIPMGASAVFTPASSPPSSDHLLSVGALVRTKGHDLALEAVATAGRRRLVVVAPRPEPEEERRLQGLASQLGVRLDLRIGITDLELRDAYRSAFALLYLARAEPLGLAALEAQACGCPVIVADDGGLPETIRDGETGWVVPRDPRAVAARLDVLEDEDRRAAMVKSAREVGAAASWEHSAKQLTTVLERVALGRTG